jgi:hypothetical protein
MEEQVRAAVFGNVGTTVAFRVGPFDAEVLETVFTPEFTKEDLVNLGAYQLYLTLMIDGVGSRPFSAVTIPPIEPPPVSYREQVVNNSRKQFAVPRAGIEEAIFSELQAAQEAAPAPAPKRPSTGPAGPRPAPARDQQKPRPQQASAQRQNQERPRPDPEQNKKTSEDLKAILRNMSSKEEKPKPKHEPQLKGALSDVLSRSDMKPPAQPKPREAKPEPSPKGEGPKPFEVPQETLQSIFKEPL